MPESRPNLVFINVDQMRYDCLSIAGHPIVETPHLDFLASRGVRFTNAFSSVMSCIGARAALHTGLSQRSHGRVGYRDGVPWTYPTTLAGELTRAGYQTQSIGKMHVHPQRWAGGFENVQLHDGMLHYYGADRQDDYADWLVEQVGPEVRLFDHGLASNSWVARPWHLDEHLHPTNWVVSRARDFLRRRDPTRPFLLYLSFVRPHAPLDPPAPYFEQYLRQDIPAPPVGDWVDRMDFGDDRWDHNAFAGRLDPRAQHRAQAGYYALITHLDHQIGRLWEYLGDYHVQANTWVVFCSDHGELMGDHTLFRKVLGYSGSAQVPLIVCPPAGERVVASRTAGQVVELRDIMPTLLEMAGAPLPAGVEGRSLLPIVRGQSPAWRSHIHGEHPYERFSNHYVTDGRYKYIWYSQTGLEQLFDIQTDRQELYDLAGRREHAATVGRYRRILVEELAGREEGYSDGTDLKVGCRIRTVLSHTLAAAGMAPS